MIKLLILPATFFGSMFMMFLLNFFRKESKSAYGLTWAEYNALPNSQQSRVRFEWELDNNKDDIAIIDNIKSLLNENKIKDIQTAKYWLKQIKIIENKYGHINFNPRYELIELISDLTPKENKENK